jgi:HEAT repeat protein
VKLLIPLFLSAALVFSQSQPDVRQSDPRQRVRAVRDFAKQGQDGIAAIAPYLKDLDLDVRLEAVKALDEIGGPKTVDPLIQAVRDNDPEVQIRATDGLVNVYLPGYIKSGISGTLKRAGASVKAKFTDTNDQIIDGFVEVPSDVIQGLGRLARSGVSMESRANAARAVGILRGRDAIPDLLEALTSKDDQVMYESLVALQKIRDPASGPKMVFLVRDLADRVQIAALQTVGILGTREAAPDVRDVFQHPRNPRVKREALETLAMLADPADHPIFIQSMAEKDDSLRAAGAEGLGRLKNPVDQAFLEKAFEAERTNNARISIAFAVVALGKRDLAEFSPLRYLINNLNATAYRSAAIAFLTELLRDQSLRQVIYPLIATATRDEKTGLSIVLARSGDKDSQPYLETLQRDPDPQVAQEGVRSLRTLRARLP